MAGQNDTRNEKRIQKSMKANQNEIARNECPKSMWTISGGAIITLGIIMIIAGALLLFGDKGSLGETFTTLTVTTVGAGLIVLSISVITLGAVCCGVGHLYEIGVRQQFHYWRIDHPDEAKQLDDLAEGKMGESDDQHVK